MILKLIPPLYDPALPFVLGEDDARAALADIDALGVAPQVYGLLRRTGRWEETPPWLRDRLRERYERGLPRQLYLHLETRRLLDRFERDGIPVIPLKGTRFAEKTFGHVGYRATSDIDLLVRPRDADRAAASLRAAGYTIEGESIRSHFHLTLAKPLPGSPDPLPAELHWGLLPDGTSKLDLEPFWERSTPLGAYRCVRELSDHHALYMICLHGWRHALDSFKYVLDIMQTIAAAPEKPDYDRLFRDARADRTERRLRSTLSAVYRQFPCLQRLGPFPLDERSGSWWSYDAIRYPERRSPTRYVRFLRYQWFDYDAPIDGWRAAALYARSLLSRER